MRSSVSSKCAIGVGIATIYRFVSSGIAVRCVLALGTNDRVARRGPTWLTSPHARQRPCRCRLLDLLDDVGAKDGPRSVPDLNTRRGPEVEQSHSTRKGK